jgi:hypothetical protein
VDDFGKETYLRSDARDLEDHLAADAAVPVIGPAVLAEIGTAPLVSLPYSVQTKRRPRLF